jgi:hypothetical protein
MPGTLMLVEDVVELAAKLPALREAGETALRTSARLEQEAFDLLKETSLWQKAIDLGFRAADNTEAELGITPIGQYRGGMGRTFLLSRFISVHGKTPENAIESAAQNSRLVAFGEWHPFCLPRDQIDTQRPFGITVMKQLRENGFTHLAVEQPVGLRASMDALINDRPLGSPLNVNELVAKKNAVSETLNTSSLYDPRRESAGGELLGLLALEHSARHSPNYVKLLLAGRDAGLKVVPIDHNRAFARIFDPLRDRTMAEESMTILNSDKNNKLVAWLGAYHATRSENSYGQIMARNFAARGLNEKATSFEFANGLVPSSIKRPTIVPTLTGNKPNMLGRFFVKHNGYGEQDQLIVLPKVQR